MKIAVFGATGFVGRHLVQKLLDQNETITAFVRNPEKFDLKHEHLNVIKADLLKKETLLGKLQEMDLVYYLVHAMKEEKDFSFKEEEQVRNLLPELSKNMRVIYLSGLGKEMVEDTGVKDELSVHLKSRQKVGDLLREGDASVIEFRASIVIGEGSLSFDMIRAIVERFPLILEAKFSQGLCQPIALQDLLNYLLEARKIQLKGDQIVEIGGPEVLPYLELLDRYAGLRQLRRPHLVLPDFPPGLIDPIMKVFLPEFQEVGRKLFSSIENPTVVTDDSATIFPFKKEDLLGINEAMKMAMEEAPKWETLSVPELFQYGQKEHLFTSGEAPLIKDQWEILLPVKKHWLSKILKKESLVSHFKLKGQVSILELELKEQNEKTLVIVKILFRPQGFLDASTFVLWQNIQSTFLDKYKIPGIFHKSL